MAKDVPYPDLARNLRHLCNQRRSVSDVCRETGINRQQFNKYLAGLHRPSPANLRRIAAYFGAAASSLELPHADFVNLIDGDYFTILDQIRRTPKARGVLDAITAMDPGVAERLIGCYERYHYSSVYPGTVLRSAFCIYRRGPLLMHYYVERFPTPDDPTKARDIFKYHGLTIPLVDRIYTVDLESLQRNEITLSLFGLQGRSSYQFVYGLTTGIVATMARSPFATRIALHYRSPGLLTRAHLRRATVLEDDDPGIPGEVRTFLNRERDMIIV